MGGEVAETVLEAGFLVVEAFQLVVLDLELDAVAGDRRHVYIEILHQ